MAGYTHPVPLPTAGPVTGSSAVRDACPLCRADLGRSRGTTRRRIVFSPVPGEFRWQCPDCRGVWSQRP